MGAAKAEQAMSRYRSMQVLLFVFSLIFFAIIAYGYFNLLTGLGYFLALVGATVMAVFAWYLARVVGTNEGGLRKNWVLFVPLLIVSAAGVYNSLMLYLEGNRILTDAIVESQDRFSNLRSAGERALSDSGATNRANRVITLREALFSEIRNPLNCGQGPEADRIIAELQQQLPGFTPLSNPRRDCSRNEAVIEDYRERINALLARATWNNPEVNSIIGEAGSANRLLEELRSTVSTSYVPGRLRETLSILETQDASYRELRRRLGRHTNVRDLEPGLHLSEAQSLGNAFKLPALFLERLDQPVTYVYLLIAMGFDLLMVYLFELTAANRLKRMAPGHSVGGVW